MYVHRQMPSLGERNKSNKRNSRVPFLRRDVIIQKVARRIFEKKAVVTKRDFRKPIQYKCRNRWTFTRRETVGSILSVFDL